MPKLRSRKILTTSSLRKTEEGFAVSSGRESQTQVASACADKRFDSFSASPRLSRAIPEPWGKEFVVVIPAFNCAKFLEPLFQSLREQTLDPALWGVLVIDDASTDSTQRVCNENGVFFITLRENCGKAWALNFAARLLPPDTILGELDADDALVGNALERMLQEWHQHHDAVFIYSNYIVCDAELNQVKAGHSGAPGLRIEDAGRMSHFKTYLAGAIRGMGYLDESIRKSIDKDLVYRLQEFAEQTHREIVFVPDHLYNYRRRKHGSITFDRSLDAVRARKNAVRRRFNVDEGAICICSVSEVNTSGGPGIFWGRLCEGFNRRTDTHMLDDPKDSDLVLGNIRISSGIDHQRPWVLRVDGAYFNSRDNYMRKNESITECVKCAEGVVFQSAWGKQMIEEYCGVPDGKVAVIPNGVLLPEDWVQHAPDARKLIVACARWGTDKPRYFKRMEATVDGFLESQLADEGYRLVIVGETYTIYNRGSKDIDYVGRVEPNLVWNYLNNAAALVHLSWFDCCPNSVVEALAAQVPVVYCADGVHELVGDAGVRVSDHALNHPCDIDKPPRLDVEEIGLALRRAVHLGMDGCSYPDVSMATCIERYAQFCHEVYRGGLLFVETAQWGRLKNIAAATSDMA